MEKNYKSTYHGFKSVQRYGIVLVCILAVIHGIAFLTVRALETNELRHELAKWSQTLPALAPSQVSAPLSLPEDILALHVQKLERVGFYETHSGENEYLAFANPVNNYILAKSERAIDREVMNFGIMLLVLFVGEIVLLLGWWAFAKSKVHELFEVE
jgi:cytochrome bd-type quinol oxidase subunit 2